MKKLLIGAFAFALTAPAFAVSQEALENRAIRASLAIKEIMRDKNIPDLLLAETDCVAAFGKVVKAGFIFGGAYGNGLITCRTADGDWSDPAYYRLFGANLGAVFGAKVSNIVLLFNGPSVRDYLSDRKLTLGADIGATVGTFDPGELTLTDLRRNNHVYAYVESDGLMLDVSLNGTYLRSSRSQNTAVYGDGISVSNVLSSQTTLPEYLHDYLDSVREFMVK